MTIRRTSGLLAAGIAASMVLAACSSEVGGSGTETPATTQAQAPSGDSSSGAEPSGETSEGETSGGASAPAAPEGEIAPVINVGLEQLPGGYNCNEAGANSVYCAYVDNLVQTSLVQVQPDGSLMANETFGSYELVSEDPMTVEVTISDDAVWSDGTPIDFDDVLLQWAAASGSYPNPTPDADGNTVDYFPTASTNGFELINMPEGEPGAKTFSWVFESPYVDWEALLSTTFIPAHVVAELAGLSPDGDGAALVTALKNSGPEIAAIAKAWGPDLAFQQNVPSLPTNFELVSSGPYQYDNASNGTITLVRNEAYWGTPAVTDSFTFRPVDDQEWIQAMLNGEIDQFDPSNPSGATVDQLKNAAGQIEYLAGESYTFSHVDFNSGPGGAMENPLVRQAFLKCVPRAELVEKFAKPVFPEAQILNLREFLPAQGNYQEILDQVEGWQDYQEVDIEGAKALLAEAGVATPYELVFTYAGTSSLRADQVQVIKASCDQAGFNITPKPDENVFDTLALKDTSWGVAVFGWAGSGLVASGQSIYVTGGDQNYGRYSNADVDAAWTEVVGLVEREEAEEAKVPMESALWTDPYNAVLYANPGIVAYSSAVTGPVFNPTQYGSTWNAATWYKSVG